MAQLSHSGRGPTDADRALAGAVSALRDEPVSDWQVKRWREKALLPTTRKFLGRGSGSEPVSYPPHAAAHAACLADTLTDYARLDEACLVCFMRGFTPPEKGLKRAYAAEYKRLLDWLERATDGVEDPRLIPYAVSKLLTRRSAGSPQARAALGRLKAAGKPRGLLREVYANLVAVFVLGIAQQIDPDTLMALGADGLLTPIGSLGALASREDLQLDWLSLPAVAETVAAATLAELERARDDFSVLLETATAFASVVSRTQGIQLDALTRLEMDQSGTAALVGVPAVILIRRRLGDSVFEQNLDLLRSVFPKAQALMRLLDAVPAQLHRHVDPSSLAAVADPDRERLLSAMRAHFELHPDDFALLQDADDTFETNNKQTIT